MSNSLDLNLQSHALSPDNEAEARLIGALLLSYLLEPRLDRADKKPKDKMQKNLKRDRRRIRLVFLARERSRLKKDGELKQLSREIKKSLGKELTAGSGLLAYAGKPKGYLPAIGPNHKPKQNDPLRQILTTGLIVLILEYMHAVEKTLPQMGILFPRLYRTYQTGTLWIINTDATPKAWGKFMPVAHLAAAWLRVLMDESRLGSTRQAFPTLQDNLPAFLGYAAHYQRFLTVDEVTGQTMHDHVKRNPDEVTLHPLLKPNQLWTLDPLGANAKVEPIPALPNEGLRDQTG